MRLYGYPYKKRLLPLEEIVVMQKMHYDCA
jgi:hypothetical protein